MSLLTSAATQAFIALGSNLGDPAGNVRVAMDRLAQFSATPLLRSSLWQSTPVDCPPGSPLFVNAAVGLTPLPGETPESLLAKVRGIEADFGRPRERVQNESRTLDLDIIAWGSVVHSSPGLVIPHPRAHSRRFVLQPLAEIAPTLVLPGRHESVTELLTELDTGEVLNRLES